MSAGEARFGQKIPDDPFYYDQPLNELNNDVQTALKATKPNVPSVSMRKGQARDN